MCKRAARERAQAIFAAYPITVIPMGKTTLTPGGKPKPLSKTALEAAAKLAHAERAELNAILEDESIAA